jgi:ABC-type multidrug transport system permease subunit
VLLAAVVVAFQPLRDEPAPYATVIGLLVLTAFAAVALGLLMSAAVRTQDQGTSFIPLVLIPQLFFGGSIVPVATMSAPLEALSKVIVAQWSYSGLGSAVDLNAKIAAVKAYAWVSRFGPDYFAADTRTIALILLGFMVVTLVLVALALRGQAGR